MTKVKEIGLFISLASIFALMQPAHADTAPLTGLVKRILIVEDNFGECMVETEVNPQDVLPSCKRFYVTMSCDGTHLSQNLGRRLLEQSQIAYALNRPVTIFIDDSRRINGYCLAYRVDTQ